jgi:hypothetical protein
MYKKKSKRKTTIPKALREQVWIQNFGETFKHSCFVSWCSNEINVYDFHVGHDRPESMGGSLALRNLKPICARCNLSMSNNYTITQWDNLNKIKKPAGKYKMLKYCCFM